MNTPSVHLSFSLFTLFKFLDPLVEIIGPLIVKQVKHSKENDYVLMDY